jgi:hypothetical protein
MIGNDGLICCWSKRAMGVGGLNFAFHPYDGVRRASMAVHSSALASLCCAQYRKTLQDVASLYVLFQIR